MITSHHQYSAGYTIIELLVTVSIFALAFTAIAAIFLGFTTAQSKASQEQRLLNEGNFIFESVVREIRMNAVDYDCPRYNGIASDSTYICLKSFGGNEIHFRVLPAGSGYYQLEVCKKPDLSSCDDQASADWRLLTPGFIRIRSFSFYVYPLQNPLSIGSPTFDTVYHPLILIRAEMETGSGAKVKSYGFQSTVSSRAYAS